MSRATRACRNQSHGSTQREKDNTVKRLFIVNVIAVSSLFSCSENDDTPLDTSSTSTTGLFTQTLSHDGITREYVIYVPDSYDGLFSSSTNA